MTVISNNVSREGCIWRATRHYNASPIHRTLAAGRTTHHYNKALIITHRQSTVRSLRAVRLIIISFLYNVSPITSCACRAPYDTGLPHRSLTKRFDPFMLFFYSGGEIINLMRPNYFMVSRYLVNIYFYIPVALDDRRFLKFEWNTLQFTVLPIGLSSAPRIERPSMPTMFHTIRPINEF